MLEYFLTNKYDNKIALINNDKSYTYCELKAIISYFIEKIKNRNQNIVISTSDNFLFVIYFFASLFCNKNIYLLSDSRKIKNLNFEYALCDDIELKSLNSYIYPEIDINKPSINFYTSGSASEPKIIKKSLFNLIKEAEDINGTFNFSDKNYEVFSTTSMCHMFGMTFHLMVPFVSGLIINTAKISYPENFNKDNSIIVSTPSFLNSVLKYDISFKKSPCCIISAGSKLDENTFSHLEKSSKIIEIYGSTETGVIAYKNHYSDDFSIFKNVELEVNEDNIEVKSDYFYDKKAVLNDCIEIHNQKLTIKRRTDRLFKIQEKRVSAEDLEEKLKKNDFIDNCYIIKNNDKLACLCALSESGKDYFIKNDIVMLTKHLKQYLFKYSEVIPQKWKYIDEIPLTQQGKVNKEIINHIFNTNLSLPLILKRKISKDSITYTILFYRQCNFFKGHFDSLHLVPGVLQLYLAKELANFHFGLNLGMGQWKRIKFTNMIQPDDIVELKLEKDDKSVAYEYLKNDKKCSSGIFLCENIFENAMKKGLL